MFPKRESILVPEGQGFRIYKRNSIGEIIYDYEAHIGVSGGYPYIKLEHDVKADEKDINMLLQHLLPE